MTEETLMRNYRLTLPEGVARVLRIKDGEENDALADHMHALAAKGWTYQSMADALGGEWTRQRAHYHASRSRGLSGALSDQDVPAVPEPPAGAERPAAAVLEPETADRLRDLQKLAVQLRGHHLADDPRREASEELSRLIDELTQRDPAPTYKQIGGAMGVEPMTVRARLKRHGYRVTNPSLTPYAGATTEED